MAPALPAIASYCATFLPREMLHVYRQVCGVRSFDHWVMTRRHANAAAFPFPQLVELRKSPWRVFNRLWHRVFSDFVPVGRFEIAQMLRFCQHRDVSLVHIYLGSEALRIVSFLERFSGDRRLQFFVAPLAPFLDPGSAAYENPQRFGYRLRFQTLKEHAVALTAPSWKEMLNYETEWMSREQIASATYAAMRRLTLLKRDWHFIDEATYSSSMQALNTSEAAVLAADRGSGFPRGDGQPPHSSLTTLFQKRYLKWPLGRGRRFGSIFSLAGIGLGLTAREARLFFGRRLPLYFSRRGEPSATTADTS